jgi:transcriptional regulator with XRE-family HTH domain
MDAMISARVKPAELARRVGVSRGAVSLWLSGATKSIDGENLTRAAAALGVNPHWLASGEGHSDQKFPGHLMAAEQRAEYGASAEGREWGDLAAAWEKMDKRTRKHMLAIAMALAENNKLQE